MNKVKLLDFYAEWCDPCTQQGPIVDELKRRMGSDISVQKIDVDDMDKNQPLINKFKVATIPTLVLLRDDSILSKFEGLTDLEILESDIKKAIKNK